MRSMLLFFFKKSRHLTDSAHTRVAHAGAQANKRTTAQQSMTWAVSDVIITVARRHRDRDGAAIVVMNSSFTASLRHHHIQHTYIIMTVLVHLTTRCAASVRLRPAFAHVLLSLIHI